MPRVSWLWRKRGKPAGRVEPKSAWPAASIPIWSRKPWSGSIRRSNCYHRRTGPASRPAKAQGFAWLLPHRRRRRLGLEVLAWIIAAATTTEKNRIKTDDICIGEGLSEAIGRVSSSLKLPEEKINSTYCDMNGEHYRSEEFTFTVLRHP